MGFESSYRRHLDAEQRRAVLEAIGSSINPDSTLGEVIDAAEALGWNEQMGGLSLADLADALLAPEENTEQAEAEEVVDEEQQDLDLDDGYDDDDDDDEPRTHRAASKKSAKTPAAKKASKKKAAKTPAAKKPSRKKSSSKKATAAKKASKKKSAKQSGRRKVEPVEPVEPVEIDDRMSLDQAADFFVPYVEELGEATMQALEEQTGIARRKLRFHVGQLVRNGYLERHGMGRGTYYTIV